MKTIKRMILMCFVLLNVWGDLQAQTSKVTQPTFRGIIRSAGDVKVGNERIQINYRKPHLPYGTAEDEFRIFADKDGRFAFKLPKFDVPVEIRINMKYNEQISKIVTYVLFEQDDNIDITIWKTGQHTLDSVTFSGKGAEKYNTVVKLRKICSHDLGYGEFRDGFKKLKFDNPENFEQKLIQYEELTDSLSRKKEAIIRNSGMSPQMQKITRYSSANIYADWVWMMSSFYNRYKDNDKTRSLIKQNFDKNRLRFSYPYDALMQYCPSNMRSLANTEYRCLVLDAGAGKVQYQDLYTVFTTKYTGPAREFLIASLFGYGVGWLGTDALSQKNVDSLIRDGEKYISIPIIKSAYENNLKFTAGSEVFNGKFTDLNGNVVSVASLKGKVVFMDFWFTGCGACATVHQNFHKAGYPHLKDNKDFVYLSVCLDKNKESWVKSLGTGTYSSQEYFNVHSDLGFDEPFVKYYKRLSFPFLLLIDKKGKIYASAIVPDPAALVKLINEALAG